MNIIRTSNIALLVGTYLFLILPSFQIIPYPFGEWTPNIWAFLSTGIASAAFISSVIAWKKKIYNRKINLAILFLSFFPFILNSVFFLTTFVEPRFR